MIVKGVYGTYPDVHAEWIAGHSPAYLEGRSDAAAGEPMPAGCSPAYAMGYNDFVDEQRAAG